MAIVGHISKFKFNNYAALCKSKQQIQALKTETDEFRVPGREIYWSRRKKRGKSIFSTVPLDRVLDKQFTIRSSRTIERLALKLSSFEERSP